MTDTVNTAREAIIALGGNRKVAVLFNTDERTVSNWRLRGLPNHSIRIFQEQLGERLPPRDKWKQLWPKMK